MQIGYTMKYSLSRIIFVQLIIEFKANKILEDFSAHWLMHQDSTMLNLFRLKQL